MNVRISNEEEVKEYVESLKSKTTFPMKVFVIGKVSPDVSLEFKRRDIDVVECATPFRANDLAIAALKEYPEDDCQSDVETIIDDLARSSGPNTPFLCNMMYNYHNSFKKRDDGLHMKIFIRG